MAKPVDDNREDAIEEAMRRFVGARWRGQEPDVDEFVRHYPGLEDQIRESIQDAQRIDALFDSLVRADQTDFEDGAAGDDLVGRKVGSFEVVEMIGRGGMGVVHLARDTRLKRPVAIKSMPAELAGDSTTRMRFRREAESLASLNHPNIAAIYEIIEQEEGACYLVLEYVPGQTLAQRIAKGPPELEEALSIALQIAEALAAAHEHDVIHRDLKPGNIKIMPEGKVKVLDFGLAKALSGESLGQKSTVTEPGQVIGTPAYMSPEQARGKPSDKRSDIWSFGCMLYEMLSGKMAFKGETVSDTLANILQTDPDWQALPQATPANIRVLLRRCLEKDPQRRLRDIGDASIEINETLSLPATAPPVTISSVDISRPGGLHRLMVWVAACLILIVAVTSLVTWSLTRPGLPPHQPIRQFVIRPETRLAFEALWHGALAISPDGKRLAYVGEGMDGRRRIYVRHMNEFEATALPGTVGATGPFFSPDGQWIGYGDHFLKKLKKVPTEGGSPVTLCDAADFAGGSWGPDDNIIFTPSLDGELQLISASGEGLRSLTLVDPNQGEIGHCWPHVLPGGEAVLFTNRRKGGFNEYKLEVLSLQTGERHIILKGGTCGYYVHTGHLLYACRTSLFAVRFDLSHLKVMGPQNPIVPVLTNADSGSAQFAVANDGSFAYVPAVTQSTDLQPVWVDKEGLAQVLPLAPRDYHSLRISPNGTHVAFDIRDGDNSDIWIYDIAHKTLTPLTSDEHSHNPVWTTDGKQLVFVSRDKLFSQPADGSTQPQPLMELKNAKYPASCSPDGKELLVRFSGLGSDIWVLPLENALDGQPVPFIVRDNNQRNAVWSPDGKWVAYSSDELGSWEVYMEPYPGPGPKIRVSADGGSQPVWSQNGKELYYRKDGKVIAVTVETKPEFRIGGSRELFDGNYAGCRVCQSYDVTPDGRFLMIRDPGESAPLGINVVLNWFEELKRLAPPGRE